MEKEKVLEKEKSDLVKNDYSLYILNDDVNWYGLVVKKCMEICNHTLEQAEQCTMIAHHNGSCEVAKGNREELLAMKRKFDAVPIGTVIK